MKFRFLMGAMLATAFCATPTWAAWNGSAHQQGAVPDSSTPKPSNYSITLTIIEEAGSTSGPCAGGKGWANWCPSGLCDCYTYTGSASGTAGKGLVTFYETLDYGAGRGTSNDGCDPAYGEIDIVGSKDVESIAFTGADCGSTAQEFLNGGCFLLGSSVYTDAIAQCSGNYSESANTKFTIKGKAIK